MQLIINKKLINYLCLLVIHRIYFMFIYVFNNKARMC
jgi:hypothetical protein